MPAGQGPRGDSGENGTARLCGLVTALTPDLLADHIPAFLAAVLWFEQLNPDGLMLAA